MTTENFTCPRHGQYTPPSVNSQDRLNQACPMCSTVAAAMESAWRSDVARWARAKDSGIPFRFRGATLARWEATTQLQEAAKSLVCGWCDELTQSGLGAGAGITFSGPPGVGKTHMAVGMLLEVLVRTDLSVGYVQWPAMLGELKASAAARNDEAARLVECMKGYDVVVLDELGVRLGTDFDMAMLFDVVDHRYREMLPTIICTNVPLDQAAIAIGERVADRLMQMNDPVNLAGPSWRRAGQDQKVLPLPIQPPARTLELPGCWAGKDTPRVLHTER